MADNLASMATLQLESVRAEVEQGLDRYSRFGEGCPALLEEAIRYSLLAPGKRLRPILVLMACESCGGERINALPAACAVEMIHAYSLIHDDLPAMDDDELRRGRPTNHIVYGEANAILAGDALIARAFEVIATELQPAEVAVNCLQTLSAAAGARNLVGGQFDDLANEAHEFDSAERQDGSDSDEVKAADAALARNSLERIHRRKTGALLVASLKMGGHVARATPEQLTSLEDYGNCLGLAFQITDDLLDLRGDEHTLGKKTGMDQQRGKLTYPGLIGVQESEQLACRLIDQAIESIRSMGERAVGLETLARFVLERSS